jgi:hypothetical protein
MQLETPKILLLRHVFFIPSTVEKAIQEKRHIGAAAQLTSPFNKSYTKHTTVYFDEI